MAPTPDRDTCCLAVDWSGAVHGERRKLWLAEARGGHVERLEGGTRTRAELVRHLLELARLEPRLVIGLDFAFSFPEWFVREQGCGSARELWTMVEREGERWLAACEPPFWGRPGKKKPALAAPYRATEGDTPPARGIGPKSVFQIGGAGAVGTGSLRGMPYLRELADAGFAVWPFHPARFPLVVEIYPRDLTGPVTKSSAEGREACLRRLAGGEAPELVRAARRSEDAFDAFVSALVMSRSAGAFEHLEPARDERERLEGRIWRPAVDRWAPAS